MTKILGHADTLAILKNSVVSQKMAHAYLFSGLDGIGKKLVAIEFACMVNCPSYDPDEGHECRVCALIRKGNHADVQIVTPLKGSIRIDSVRQIHSFLKYSPVEAQYRVIIIDDAHLLNRSAQNALLKTLEEPPGSSLLILVTSRASALLSTVKSRLRHVRFGPLERSLISEELVRRKRIPSDQAASLAGLASGSLGRALELLSVNTLKFRNSLTDFLTNAPR
ncbi:MAG: DNA polymerase III subunit delta', partial [Desulfomonilaceae bacterium]